MAQEKMHHIRFLRDSRGATIIPVRLALSIILIAAMGSLFYVGLQHFIPIWAEGKVEQQVTDLDTMLHEIVTGSTRNLDLGENYIEKPGERRPFTFRLPSQLIYLGIGVDPDPDNNGVLERYLTGEGNIIVYRVEGRGKKTYWLDEDIKIRMGVYENNNWNMRMPEEGLIIEGGGTYEIVFELVQYLGKKYILIQANNSADIPYRDNEPPTVFFTYPFSEEYNMPFGSITLSWVTFDNIGMHSIKLEYKNTTSEWNLLDERPASQWEQWEYTVDSSILDPDEEYRIRITAVDNAGNNASDEVHIIFE